MAQNRSCACGSFGFQNASSGAVATQFVVFVLLFGINDVASICECSHVNQLDCANGYMDASGNKRTLEELLGTGIGPPTI